MIEPAVAGDLLPQHVDRGGDGELGPGRIGREQRLRGLVALDRLDEQDEVQRFLRGRAPDARRAAELAGLAVDRVAVEREPGGTVVADSGTIEAALARDQLLGEA